MPVLSICICDQRTTNSHPTLADMSLGLPDTPKQVYGCAVHLGRLLHHECRLHVWNDPMTTNVLRVAASKL